MSADTAAETYVFRCDYCATLVPIGRGLLGYSGFDELGDGQILVYPAPYCGPYCAERAGRAGSGTVGHG